MACIYKRACLVQGFLGLLLAISSGCQKTSQKTSTETSTNAVITAPIVVTVAPIELRSVQRTVSLVGTLVGREEVFISPKVEGKIRRINHDRGDIVKPGDVLAEIDPTDYELAVTERKRAYELSLTRPPVFPLLHKAFLERQYAQRKYERVAKLGRTGATSEEELTQLRYNFDLADENWRFAFAEVQAMLAESRLRQAELATAEQRLADTVVRVPNPAEGSERTADGMEIDFAVAQRMVSVGEIVRIFPSNPIFKLVCDRELKLIAAVPERHVPEIQIDQIVHLTVDSAPGKIVTGKVSRIAATIDEKTRTLGIEVRIPNRERQLKAGSFAKGTILTRIDPAVPTVPPEAIVTSVGVSRIFILEDGKARSVKVAIGQREKEWAEIIGDFPPNARVLTSGLARVTDGTPIRLRD